MTELPRSRALVRLDGPRHIMPVEPVTPADSVAWRIAHMPATLAAAAGSLLVLAVLAINPVDLGVRLATDIPGARYLLPLISAAATVTFYWAFVRIVERRRTVEELGGHAWLREVSLGLAAGLVQSCATFGILAVLGCVRIDGFNSPRLMALPIVIQLCTAVVLELVVCGLCFRLVERLVGSWLALLAIMVAFAWIGLLTDNETAFAVLAVMLEAALLFGVAYMATRRLWAAIGLQAGWKVAQTALYGVAMSPGGPHGFVLSRVIGPDWLTGGGAGTNSSVPALVVDALLLAVLLAIAVRRGRIVRPAWRRGRAPGTAPTRG